jgi:uncharacterized RDD family membrane protein YckC
MSDPYAPPKANVADALPPGLPLSTPLAGSGARFANLLLDWVFAWIFIMACAFVAGLVLAWLDNRTWHRNPLTLQLFWMLAFTGYYLLFEGLFGWTLAKLITGTRVVDEEGRKPAFLNLLGRSLARNVPFEPFSYLGKTGIGWHDRWSGTRVVSIRRASGPTLADSFKPGFRKAPPEPPAPERIEPTWTPADGPAAWCPNCARQIAATAEKCVCGADFTSPEGWKPLAERP